MRIVQTALVVWLSLASLAYAQTDHVAVFKNVAGQVVVVRGDSELVPGIGSNVVRTDVIRTGPNSSAGIVFMDGTRLTVGASTELQVRQYVFEPADGKYDFNAFLKKGSVVYSSGKLGKLAPEAVSLNTPRATTGVRGTRFILKEE